MYTSTGNVIKQLVHAFSSAYIELWCTWEVWKALKKLQFLSAVASSKPYASYWP